MSLHIYIFNRYFIMMNLGQPKGDNFDLSWIQKQTDCWVYFPNEQRSPLYAKAIIKGIVPLTFNKGNSKVLCQLQNGMSHETKAMHLEKRRHSNRIQKDLIDLDVINPAQILDQLRRRLEDDKIHIYLWNSLIIVNPFYPIEGMYEQEVMEQYMNKIFRTQKQLHEVQPHIFGFVCNILRQLGNSTNAQMLSISGQSGSGKTETNKQCLRIISYVCENSVHHESHPSQNLIEERILHCDHILECFGNAKTQKNNNSSRFGKLVTEKIHMKTMHIAKCQIRAFFLEKSRIVHQFPGQRNFHIFYQLLYFCPEDKKSHFGFPSKTNVTDYIYLQRQYLDLFEEDKDMWKLMHRSFNRLGFNEALVMKVLDIIAGILHLGNLKFDQTHHNDNTPCEIVNEETIPMIANLLSITKQELYQILVYYKKVIAGQTMHLPMTQRQCIEGRDSLAKSLYEQLFLWIVDNLNLKVNEHSMGDLGTKVIKMLDIYGFQVFQHNSFEQLCVNYTNQRIHQVYLDQVFKHEKLLLQKQGLQAIIPSLKFTDNIKIIQLLESSLKSIFNLLDQSCSLNVRDIDLLGNIKKFNEGHPNFPPSNNITFKNCFIIKHTPGDIQYMIEGFRMKNKDFMRDDIIDALTKSESPIIKPLFISLQEKMKKETNKKFLGFKIRREISQLISEMSTNTDLHFVRCIKPNEEKNPFQFVDKVCYNQIRYLGVLDTVAMRKDTYHVRIKYRQFYKKYGILNKNIDQMIKVQKGAFTEQQCKDKTKKFFQNNFKNKNLHYLFGNEKLFLKMDTNNFLQTILKKNMASTTHSCTIIKGLWRYLKNRHERKNYLVHVRKIQKSIKSFLRDLHLIRKKNAVKVIQREWIKRCQQYFRRKKRTSIMVLQKYIKRAIVKKDYLERYSKIEQTRDIIRSAVKSHKKANEYERFIEFRELFEGKVYDTIWNKVKIHYTKTLQVYIQNLSNARKNSKIIKAALEKTQNRLINRNKVTVEKYFKSVHSAVVFQRYRTAVIKIQRNYRMRWCRIRFNSMKEQVIRIQRAWRRYKYEKLQSQKFTLNYFGSPFNKEQDWKSQLFRNLKKKVQFQSPEIGMQRILQKYEKIKKDKISIFYYLFDMQIIYDDLSLKDWCDHYLQIAEQSLLKQTPLQYMQVTNTHTVATTISKLYTWGQIQVNPNIKQHVIPEGKLHKIFSDDYVTKVQTLNPNSKFFVGCNPNSEKQYNKDWNTLNNGYVLLNGIVLTVEGVSYTKINVPEKVTQISCGMGHVICKSLLKRIYTWGNNTMGQLGVGDYLEKGPNYCRPVEFFSKKRIPVVQVGATAYGSVVLDSNNKIYWFGSNGTIKNVCYPQQASLSMKSSFLANHHKYSVIRIIPKWSKTISIIGVTIACHDGVLKNQISLRKKILQGLMSKWNEDLQTINPPYSASLADHISERHMQLPTTFAASSNAGQKTMGNREIREKLISQIQKMEQAEKQLLRTKKGVGRGKYH